MNRNRKTNKGKKLRDITRKDRVELVSRIKALKEKRGWTQKTMADAFGLTPSAIAQWELGLKHPSGTALKLLEIYERLEI